MSDDLHVVPSPDDSGHDDPAGDDALERDLRALFAPIPAPPAFRERLRAELLHEADRLVPVAPVPTPPASHWPARLRAPLVALAEHHRIVALASGVLAAAAALLLALAIRGNFDANSHMQETLPPPRPTGTRPAASLPTTTPSPTPTTAPSATPTARVRTATPTPEPSATATTTPSAARRPVRTHVPGAARSTARPRRMTPVPPLAATRASRSHHGTTTPTPAPAPTRPSLVALRPTATPSSTATPVPPPTVTPSDTPLPIVPVTPSPAHKGGLPTGQPLPTRTAMPPTRPTRVIIGPTPTPRIVPTATATPSATPVPLPPTATPTPLPSATPSASPTATRVVPATPRRERRRQPSKHEIELPAIAPIGPPPIPLPRPTIRGSAGIESVPTATATRAPSATATVPPSATATPRPTITPTPSATASPTASPSATASPTRTATPRPTVTATATALPPTPTPNAVRIPLAQLKLPAPAPGNGVLSSPLNSTSSITQPIGFSVPASWTLPQVPATLSVYPLTHTAIGPADAYQIAQQLGVSGMLMAPQPQGDGSVVATVQVGTAPYTLTVYGGYGRPWFALQAIYPGAGYTSAQHLTGLADAWLRAHNLMRPDLHLSSVSGAGAMYSQDVGGLPILGPTAITIDFDGSGVLRELRYEYIASQPKPSPAQSPAIAVSAAIAGGQGLYSGPAIAETKGAAAITGISLAYVGVQGTPTTDYLEPIYVLTGTVPTASGTAPVVLYVSALQ